ncbi:MAG: penicillin-binding transpeptidase domain-containing protein [bacterium]|nr:penicillin-binding transpeptidase domain-containing protein [bacterium]
MKTVLDEMHRRSAVCLLILISLMLICVLRILVLASDKSLGHAAVAQSSVSIDLYRCRGEIYDTNMLPITSASSKMMSVITATPQGVVSAASILDDNTYSRVLSRLSNGFGVLVDSESSGLPGIIPVRVPLRYTKNQCAAHVVGYINGDGHGVSGLEAGLDELLYSGKFAKISFTVDAANKILLGAQPIIANKTSNSSVVLTIDSKIQEIAEKALDVVDKGAVVVTEARTGKIRALASAPVFNPLNPQENVDDKDSPFINRALNAYSVGSVFKVCVAAAAIDHGLDSFVYECTGNVAIDGINFNCHKKDGHGRMNMQTALAHSCNCYFYNLAIELGAKKIHSTAANCGFGMPINLGGGLTSAAGIMPDIEKISTLKGALANFSIGQGQLLLTPLSLTTLYSAVCCDGSYVQPYLIEGFINDTGYTQAKNSTAKTGVMKKSTAQKLKNYLIEALNDGTGVSAKPSTAVGGGKTATAQTGQLIDRRQIENGWFCGFVEINNSLYVISVFVEDAVTGSSQSSQIFKTIADNMAKVIG